MASLANAKNIGAPIVGYASRQMYPPNWLELRIFPCDFDIFSHCANSLPSDVKSDRYGSRLHGLQIVCQSAPTLPTRYRFTSSASEWSA
jgi:hypothetical protein